MTCRRHSRAASRKLERHQAARERRKWEFYQCLHEANFIFGYSL